MKGVGMRSAGFLTAGLLVFSWTSSSGEPSGEQAFHLMKIKEVFSGTPAAPAARYVELQMYAAGQNFVSGHSLILFGTIGNPIQTVTFSADVASGVDQSSILIATPEAEALFNITADLQVPSLNLTGFAGKICFDVTDIDCFAWGVYLGSNAGVGTNYNIPWGIIPGTAARRDISAGNPSVLEAGDDTDESDDDFNQVVPSPRNNAGVVGVPPISTCGNGVIEGLEQCDDGNTTSGDGCDATCADEYCGDGVVQPNEECDDGNKISGDGCDVLCNLEVCGNGIVDAGEECDDGNLTNGDGCDALCQFENTCGNSIIETGEECDDGNTIPGDGCDGNCLNEISCLVVKTGDVNVSGTITSSDIIGLVNYVFKSGLPPQPCPASGDVNCNGVVTSADIIGLVNFVFKSGLPPCNACTIIPSLWSCP